MFTTVRSAQEVDEIASQATAAYGPAGLVARWICVPATPAAGAIQERVTSPLPASARSCEGGGGAGVARIVAGSPR